MCDENTFPMNAASASVGKPTAVVTDCHKRWMEISRESLAPKITEFPNRVAELTKMFEPKRTPLSTLSASQTEVPEVFGQDMGVNTEISGNFRLHVAEVQSYLTEIASLRRAVTSVQREATEFRQSKEEEIADLRHELRVLGEMHADEKENFRVEMSTTIRNCKAEIRKLEGEISTSQSECDQLKDELNRRLRQLSIAAEKYKKLKIGNSNLQQCDFQWQQKFFDMQSELELQRENFRQQITDLYWETVHEYEAAFTAELAQQQDRFNNDQSATIKKHRDQIWKILVWSQALTVFLAFLFLSIR